MSRFATSAKTALVAVVGMFALSACSVDPYGLPLPGGADVGDNPMEVTVEFRDVMDLVRLSGVRVDDGLVGRVVEIKRDGWHARVKVLVNGDVELPDNATASIRQTSVLGEKFVSLDKPEEGATGRLESGDTIPLNRTGRNPEIEEIFGAASLLLNGGGIDKVNTIVKELNNALDGNEPEVKQLLRSTEQFLGQIDARKGEVIHTLEQVNRLSTSINAERASIDNALANLPGALRVLEDQRDDLVGMLNALNNLGDSATGLVRQIKADVISSLQSLQPILHYLGLAADDLAGNLSTTITYPFPDSIVGGTVANASQPCDYAESEVISSPESCWGDYYNLVANVHLDLSQLNSMLGIGGPAAPEGAGAGASAASAGGDAAGGAAGTDGLVELIEGLVPVGLGDIVAPQGGSQSAEPSTSDTGGGGGGLVCSLLGSCRAPAASSSDLELLFGLEATR